MSDKLNVKNKFKHNDKDTGSVEVQICDMTAKINHLVEHFKVHKADFSGRRGLTTLVNRRRNFLDYIKKDNEALYKQLVESLGLRK